VLGGLAGQFEKLFRQFPGTLHGFAATRCEKDAVEVPGCFVREALG
jgi:hypothetical protein